MKLLNIQTWTSRPLLVSKTVSTWFDSVFHTLTNLPGLDKLIMWPPVGEKHNFWTEPKGSSRVTAHAPVAVSQTRIVLSCEALAMKLAFGENLTSFTDCLWPSSLFISEPLTNAPVPGWNLISRTVLSSEQEARCCPVEDIAHASTGPEWTARKKGEIV